MKHKAAISAFVALTIATGPLAFAQGNRDRDRNDGRQSDRRDARDNRHDNRDFGRRHNEERNKGRGVGPNYEYYRGDRLPIEYRHRNYVVDDWRGHHLSAPPRGYQWVQSGSDYILVAIATGIILQLLLNH
jgi:Ni/Co efflux regulator RcnB